MHKLGIATHGLNHGVRNVAEAKNGGLVEEQASVFQCLGKLSARQRLTHTLTGNAHRSSESFTPEPFFTLDPRYEGCYPALTSTSLQEVLSLLHTLPETSQHLLDLLFSNSASLFHLRAFPSATPSLRSSPLLLTPLPPAFYLSNSVLRSQFRFSFIQLRLTLQCRSLSLFKPLTSACNHVY